METDLQRESILVLMMTFRYVKACSRTGRQSEKHENGRTWRKENI